MNRRPIRADRFVELDGSPVKAGHLGKIFNRWSVCAAVASSAAMFSADSDRAPLAFQQGLMGLAIAQVYRMLLTRLTKNRIGNDFVIDTSGLRHFVPEEAFKREQARFIANLMAPCGYGTHILSTVGIITGHVLLLPISAEMMQSDQILRKISSGEWTLMHRSEMQKIMQRHRAPGP